MGENMLIGPGQYGDVLRVIGRLLDEREAVLRAEAVDPSRHGHDGRALYEDVEIVEHDSYVRVSWRTRGGSGARQAYTDVNLAQLRARSRQLRADTSADPGGEREELLRTLGQELDADDLRVSGIFEKEQDFFVSGSAGGRYVNRSFAKDELLLLSQHRRQLRPFRHESGPAAAAPEPEEPNRAHWLLWRVGARH
jgi:hypothetical protein